MPAVASNALSSSVLVLNRYYMAVHVVNVRRALGLLFRELAEVIHLEEGQYANYNFETWLEISTLRAADKQLHDDWIRGINFELQVPRVIRLLSFDRVPRQSVRFNRRNLFARDGNHCQYCGKSFPTSELSLDHIMPRSRGGETVVGKHRLRLRRLQRPQRRPHAARSPYEAHSPAGQTQAQPAALGQARQPQVPILENLRRQRLLDSRFEVNFSPR